MQKNNNSNIGFGFGFGDGDGFGSQKLAHFANWSARHVVDFLNSVSPSQTPLSGVTFEQIKRLFVLHNFVPELHLFFAHCPPDCLSSKGSSPSW